MPPPQQPPPRPQDPRAGPGYPPQQRQPHLGGGGNNTVVIRERDRGGDFASGMLVGGAMGAMAGEGRSQILLWALHVRPPVPNAIVEKPNVHELLLTDQPSGAARSFHLGTGSVSSIVTLGRASSTRTKNQVSAAAILSRQAGGRPDRRKHSSPSTRVRSGGSFPPDPM